MREYRIYKTWLWYAIYRKKHEWKILMLQFLNGDNTRSTNKTTAKTFYHEEDAVSALVLMKHKDEKKSD